MNGTEKLLARIKALFAPNRAAEPSTEVEPTPPPAPPAALVAETQTPEPIVAVAEPTVEEVIPVIAETPPVAAVIAPTLPEIAPTPTAEAPAEVERVPTEGLTLRLETERGPQSTFQVTKSGATIGRGPESTIQLADLSVSRKHARIAYKQGAYWLSDLGSMGGTWVDGTKLAAPRRVATGQTIDIGLCRLVAEVAAEEPEEAGAAKGPSSAA